MAHSSIPTLKSNLVSALQVRPNLASVQVTYGPPLPNPTREYIWVGKASGTQTWTAQGVKQEDYDLEVQVSVLWEGVDSSAADARCFTIYAEIDDTVRIDKTVAGAVHQANVTGFELGEAVTDSQREASLTVQISCRAYL